MPLDGQLLERYRLIHLIGSGGMGKVYLARDTHIPRQVALKVVQTEPTLHTGEQDISDALRLFHREMEVIARLDHAHILPLYDFGETRIETNLIAYMAMPYRSEGSLDDWLQRLDASHPLSFQDIGYLVAQAADALQHAHEHGIVHQDVKPSNFLVREKTAIPNRPDIFLVDFGVAKLTNAALASSQSVRGTPAYMAPEQWNGEINTATDQYALAIMTYYLLTDRPPFTGNLSAIMYQHLNVPPPPPSTYNANISSKLDAVLLHALAKQPENRFSSITHFARAFKQALHRQNPHQSSMVNGYTPQHAFEPVQQPLAPTLNVPQQLFLSGSIDPDPNEQNGIVAHSSQSTHTVMPPSDTHAQRNNAPMLHPPYPPAPDPQPRRSRSFLLSFVIGMLAFLIILAGIAGVFFYQHYQNTASIDAANTAQAGNATSTSQIGATNTAVGQKTAAAEITATNIAKNATQIASATAMALSQTAVAGVTATASVRASNHIPGYMSIPESVQSTLVVYDPLGQKGQWDTQPDTNGGSCRFSDNTSYIVEQDNNGFFYCPSLSMFNNFAFEVKMAIIQGSCGGILFRVDNSNPTHLLGYYFQICQNGDYKLLRLSDNVLTDATVLGSGNSLAFNSVNSLNTIAIVAEEGTITPYVNGRPVQIATPQDNSYTDGRLALAAATINGTTQVEFSNARVWTLQ